MSKNNDGHTIKCLLPCEVRLDRKISGAGSSSSKHIFSHLVRSHLVNKYIFCHLSCNCLYQTRAKRPRNRRAKCTSYLGLIYLNARKGRTFSNKRGFITHSLYFVSKSKLTAKNEIDSPTEKSLKRDRAMST